MPELPEVEAARSLAARYCPGRKILSATVADDDKVINGIPPRDLEAALQGRSISAACRKGKQLWLDLGPKSPALMLHFGMTGCLVVKGVDAVKYVNAKTVDPDLWPPKCAQAFWRLQYCKIELELDDGTKLAFCDSRRFARANWQEDPLNNPPVSLLGPDILNDRPTAEELSKALGKKRSAIKSVIMDQSVLAGVGNWVADEVLHTARIHPCERACDLTEDQTEALRAALLEVAQKSTEVDADSSRFPDGWLFSHRWTQKQAPGHLEFLTVGGRTTCYEPTVQKLMSPAAEADGDEGGKGVQQKKKATKPKRAAESPPAAEKAEPQEATAESSGTATKGESTARGRKQGKATAASRKAAAKDAHTEAAVAQPANKRKKRKA